jgi:hypothetical protein
MEEDIRQYNKLRRLLGKDPDEYEFLKMLHQEGVLKEHIMSMKWELAREYDVYISYGAKDWNEAKKWRAQAQRAA